MKLTTCDFLPCANLLRPPCGGGRPAQYCAPEHRREQRNLRRRAERDEQERLEEVQRRMNNEPCTDVPCRCGRDYLTVVLLPR